MNSYFKNLFIHKNLVILYTSVRVNNLLVFTIKRKFFYDKIAKSLAKNLKCKQTAFIIKMAIIANFIISSNL